MRFTVPREGAMEIEANRTELIRLANELLTRADMPEHDFDARDCHSPRNFTLDEPVNDFAFIRQKEEPPRRSALERAPHEALDAGHSP